MALTDHDSFRGVDRARSVAHRRGLGYVRALEVTTFPPNQMRHILGHGVDLNHPRLLALLDRTQGVFRRQTEAWIEVLREQGIGNDIDLGAVASRPTVMPGAVLKLIRQHGLMTEKDAWESVRKAVDFMPPEFYAPIPSPKEAVEAIHAAGGLAVHAHPGSVPDQDLMKEVLPLVDGLEVYTRRHKPEQIPVYEELAGRHRLLMTVGSDYHGFNGDDYEAPKKLIDIRYLEKLGARVACLRARGPPRGATRVAPAGPGLRRNAAAARGCGLFPGAPPAGGAGCPIFPPAAPDPAHPGQCLPHASTRRPAAGSGGGGAHESEAAHRPGQHPDELRHLQRPGHGDGTGAPSGPRRHRPRRCAGGPGRHHDSAADGAVCACRLTPISGKVAPKTSIAMPPATMGSRANRNWPLQSQAKPPRAGPKNAAP